MYPEEQLNYRNLLGACKGGERPNSRDQHCDTEKSSQSLSSKGEKVHQYHCDTKKGSQSLSFNPADPHFDIEATIKYLGDGEISSSNAEINRELGEAVLNLNLPMLKSNRKAVLDGFRLALKLKPGKKLDEAKELAKWDGSQPKQLPEYAAVVACYLRKKLRQK